MGRHSTDVTERIKNRIPQFYLTPAGPCPYLPDRYERKVFTRLEGGHAEILHDALTHSGFRRSQNIAYKPACDGCSACVSVRIPVSAFVFTRNRRRILARNADLQRGEISAAASREQYSLLRRYLDARHTDGGMNAMSLFDYASMVEETTVETKLFEYRRPPHGELTACALTDILSDGVSMVYSFFHPGLNRRSLGTFMILDHIRMAGEWGLPYVYLGYWVHGSRKMEYKINFRPIETLTGDGWQRMDDQSICGGKP